MTWRAFLSLFMTAARPVSSLREDCLARLGELDRHVAEARRVEASAHITEARVISDPYRAEMRRLDRERMDAIDAAFRGKDDA